MRIEAQHGFPSVERAREIAAVDCNARDEIVRFDVLRMPLESSQRDLERHVELVLPAQRLAQLQKHETRRIARELVAPPPNVVSHWPPPREAAVSRSSAAIASRARAAARSSGATTKEMLPARARRGVVAEPRRRERKVEMDARRERILLHARGAVHRRRRRDARRA